MNVLSLFTGIGAHDLGLERSGMEIIGQCEIDDFCTKILESHWPSVARWKDVSEVTAESVFKKTGKMPDLVTGGFPCVDVSVAGKGEGIGTKEKPTKRSGLFWQLRRVVEDCSPSFILIENVPALRIRGADPVLNEMEGLGYACWPLVVGSWAVGAPHKRDRVWIIGYSPRAAGRRKLANSNCPGRGELCRCESVQKEYSTSECQGPYRWPARPGQSQREWEHPRFLPIESGLGQSTSRNAGGMVGRGPMLRALGNCNPPQLVKAIGTSILALDKKLSSNFVGPVKNIVELE